MLQAFTIERGAASGCTNQETTRLRITGRPRKIANALETEHGVVNVERHHRLVVHRIRRARRHPRRHCAGFVDALFQNTALLVFAVIHHLTGVFRFVELADWE
jgi:hypothetical protein